MGVFQCSPTISWRSSIILLISPPYHGYLPFALVRSGLPSIVPSLPYLLRNSASAVTLFHFYSLTYTKV